VRLELVCVSFDGYNQPNQGWAFADGGSGAAFILGEPDSREVLNKLELHLVLELPRFSKEHQLTGQLSIQLLLVHGSHDTSCSSSSSALCSPSGHSVAAAGIANQAVCPKGNSVRSFALPLSKGT